MKKSKNHNVVCKQNSILVDTSIIGKICLIQESGDSDRGPEEIRIHYHFAKELCDAILAAFHHVESRDKK